MRNKHVLALTVFLSAFLLFLVQPMVAKLLLPQFGGTSAVWATCLVFFQVFLLLGYVYADWLYRRLTSRHQAVVHSLVLVSALAVFPIEMHTGVFTASIAHPGLRVLCLLGLSIGLPYFVLASTGPLLQSLFAARHPGENVYRLYSISNLASLLALLAYPFTIERWWSVQDQLSIWAAGYALFTLLCLVTVWLYSARPVARESTAIDQAGAAEAAPDVLTHLKWVFFAALATALLVAATANISLNVASIPLFWILPLAVYLFSFVVTFDSQRWYSHRLATVPMMVFPLLMLLTWRTSPDELSLASVIAINVIGLFACCWFLHGELSACKPSPRYLTRFYLLVSLGGATGGVFGSLLAPMLFSGFHEMQVLLLLVAVAALWIQRRYLTRHRAAYPVLALFAASVVLCSLLALSQYRRDEASTLVSMRNFYAVSSVKETGLAGREVKRSLYNGSILHGSQIVFPVEASRRPGDYYGPLSGIGLALEPEQPGPRDVGVIGLGAGVLAAYNRPGDRYSFFEINPHSVLIAKTHFSYLQQSRGTIDIVEGDARLVLEGLTGSAQAHHFDVLAVDAFSGDAIPMHLLTLEAFQVYLSQLAPTGVLAIHVSNKYLDLRAPLQALSEAAGLQALWINDQGDGDHQFANDWVLMTRNLEAHRGSRWLAKGRPLQSSPRPGPAAWTDARHNLLDAVVVNPWH